MTLRNPFELVISRHGEKTIHTSAQHIVDIPPVTSTTVLSFSKPLQPQIRPAFPTLMIGKSLRSLQDPIVRMGSALLLQCKNSQNVTIPHWIVLPRPDEGNSVATYLACTIITRENQEFVTYKRLFPSSWFKASRHFVYDLHRGGRWIRMCGETVSEISGNFLQSLAPCYIHYEQVFH